MVAVTSQQGQRAARSSIRGLGVDSGKFTQGGLGLQVILNTINVSVLAQNHAREYFPPATAIQRSQHCQTRGLGQKQARHAGHEPLPIRGSQTLDQVKRQSTISLVGLSTTHDI